RMESCGAAACGTRLVGSYPSPAIQTLAEIEPVDWKFTAATYGFVTIGEATRSTRYASTKSRGSSDEPHAFLRRTLAIGAALPGAPRSHQGGVEPSERKPSWRGRDYQRHDWAERNALHSLSIFSPASRAGTSVRLRLVEAPEKDEDGEPITTMVID